MQNVDSQNRENALQLRDDRSRTDAGEFTEWIDRLKDCNQRIDNLRIRYSNALTTQAKKWDDYVQPLKQREPRSENIRQSIQHVCSSTPIALWPGLQLKPQSKSSDLIETRRGARAPMKAVALFDESYSEDVDCRKNFEWVTVEDDNKPDDDFDRKPIGGLKPSTMKAALANQMLTEPENGPSHINASWNPSSMDRNQHSAQDSDHPHSNEFNDDASRNIDWLDRLRNCVQTIDDLSSRYKNALSAQARKWDNFVAETFDRTQLSGELLLRRPRNLGSSTPIPMGQSPAMKTELNPMGPTQTNLARATPGKIILFSDDDAGSGNPELNFEWKTTDGDSEPDDDFRGRPIGRLSPTTMKKALGCSGVPKQILVPELEVS